MFEKVFIKIMTPAIGSSLRNWMKIIFFNRSIALKYYLRVFLTSLVNLIWAPFRIYEYLRLNKRIKKTIITHPPIFIIGHWRTGTSHLHNLLCQDPQFGFVSTLQATFPKSFMSNNFFKRFMKTFMPKKRFMDNMKLNVNTPQEDEMALANTFLYSFYNCMYFPQKMMDHYSNSVRFRNVLPRVKEQWRSEYKSLLKKATLNMNGKRLVLKNPSNTARIKILLELFPDAKFIHLYRNPFVIYVSTQNFYQNVTPLFMLQEITKQEINDNIIRIYKEMMTNYFKEKHLIPAKNLVEIKFEDLEVQPIDQLKKIYTDLDLNGFENAKTRFEKYLKTIKNYKKNIYKFTRQIIERVKRYWSFTINKWDYDIPENIDREAVKP